MRINKKFCAVIEWIVAILLLVIAYKYSLLSYGSFSPLKAHEQSERTYHYGPSTIIRTIDLDGEKIYLCRYKDWFSISSVNRKGIKWYPGNNVSGTPIDKSKQVSYNWGGSSNKEGSMRMVVYGYVSDPNITTMSLEESGKDALRYELGESRMFIFYWNEDSDKRKDIQLRGIDKEGKAVYEGITF